MDNELIKQIWISRLYIDEKRTAIDDKRVFLLVLQTSSILHGGAGGKWVSIYKLNKNFAWFCFSAFL